MAKNYVIEIDGYLSPYTRNEVKSILASAEKNPVTCNVYSYGGDFFAGMNIKDQFAAHGNVTVDISGIAASAATIIGLGAKHTRISNTSFYLIHKVSSWVDEWGTMNEDQIAEVIAKLEKEKDENAKMSLVLAQAYADKSGKSVTEIIDLMKEGPWLNADEAKEWGFVDEVYKAASKVNFKEIGAKFNRMGIPALPENKPENLESEHEGDKLATKIINGVRDLFNPKESEKKPEQAPELDPSTELEPIPANNQIPKTIPMNKFGKINSVLGVDTLESTDKKGVYLNEAALQKINDILTEGEKHKVDHDSVVAKMDLLHPDIKTAEGLEGKFTALQTKLANMPSVAPSGAIGDNPSGKKDDGIDHETLNSLDHMKEDEND